MNEDVHNPFQPGPGRPPPHRAGHERAVSVLNKCLRGILGPAATGDGVVMFGPRGNGKTTLLNELKDLALKEGVTVRHLSAQNLSKGAPQLCQALFAGAIESTRPEWWAESAWWKKTAWRARAAWRSRAGLWHQGKWWAKAGVLSVTSFFNVGFRQQARIESAMRDLLEAGPVLLLVDEAHEMPGDLGKYLLQATQQCFGERLPLLLVLAGTPSIKDALSATHASFWERLRKVRIGRLETKVATRDALAIPAEGTGMPFDEDALDLLVEESQLYPYFVQMLGEAAWDAAKDAGHERITLQDARQGIERSVDERRDFYSARVEELEKRGIIVEAKAVSRAMSDLGENPKMSDDVLSRVLSEAAPTTGNVPEDVKIELSRLGLIWRMPTLEWEPGIPSLCDFLVRAPVGEPGGHTPGRGDGRCSGQPADAQG